jgi:hypothetical protein
MDARFRADGFRILRPARTETIDGLPVVDYRQVRFRSNPVERQVFIWDGGTAYIVVCRPDAGGGEAAVTAMQRACDVIMKTVHRRP